jgi:hypothetical protein
LGGTIACAPKEYKPFIPPKVEFEKTEKYVLDLSALQKPDKPNYVALGPDFKPITAENPGEAKYLAFTRDEFKKIMALSAGYNSQQVLLKDHEALVNTYIAEINALKELVALREQIIEQYIQLYAMSENAYRQERYEHKWDNAENKIVQVLMMAGLVLLML